MNIVYLDNASNTRMRKEVKEIYYKLLCDKYISNPSSFHYLGRYSRYYIEQSREKIAKIINCNPYEIIFTSSGTESNNLIIAGAVKYYNIKYIITSKLEHLSILNIIKNLNKKKNIKVFYLNNSKLGVINLKMISEILKKKTNYKYNILVTLMAINNEIGNINNINKIGIICNKYNALFHSDFIQLIGHYKVDVRKISCHFFSASAHKFYGPLGVGFIYKRKGYNLDKFILGGNQEQKIRAGTENLYGIVGLYYALKIFKTNYKKEKKKITKLKKYCIKLLKNNIPKIKYNGLSNNISKSSYSILNIRLPIEDSLIHIKLDLNNIIISKGSSCYYSNRESHVIKNLINKSIYNKSTSLRISFGIYNNKNDVNKLVKVLKKIMLC